MKLILDFDDVLFNSSKLKEKFFAVLAFHGVKNAEEEYHFERANDRPFSLWLFLKRICREEDMRDAGLLYEEIMSTCHECRNEAVIEVVNKVGRDNCYIVSNGESEFQNEKLVRSGIYTLVREVFVVPGSKKEVIEGLCQQWSKEEVVFAEDKDKFLNDIDEVKCPNLRKVLFDKNGLEKLELQVEGSLSKELAIPNEQGFLGAKLR